MTKDMNCSKLCEHCGQIFYRDKRNTWSYWAKAKFCSRMCASKNWVDSYKKAVPTMADAFYKKVVKGDSNECWQWAGTKDKDGYPLLTFRKKLMRANRVALVISGVQISDGQHACHSCGNNWCCNPDHLYAGSPRQNNNDKKQHGTHLEGEAVYCSKLTEQDVLAIRSMLGTNRVIGQIYGVSPSLVSMIKKKKIWRHVP